MLENHVAFAILAGAAGLGSAVAAWFGWQNLKQSEVLANATPFARLAHNVGRCVALRGRPEVTYAGTDPFRKHLWCKRTREQYVYESSGADRGRHRWETIESQELAEDFLLQGEGGVRVRVRNQPTEVHGTQQRTEGRDGGSLFTRTGETRVRIEWLPANLHALTVCGRLVRDGEGFAIVRDDALGLLLSPRDAATQARHEAMKGWLGLAAPIAWLIGSLLVWRSLR